MSTTARDAPTACPGCGVHLPSSTAPATMDATASRACDERFGHLLARSYERGDLRATHQLLVDAWVVQHAGGRGPRQVQRVGLCLMTLLLVHEFDLGPERGPAMHARMMRRPPDIVWLEPPSHRWRTTVVDLLAARDAVAHHALARAWAAEAWTAWTPHHDVVRRWVVEAGVLPSR